MEGQTQETAPGASGSQTTPPPAVPTAEVTSSDTVEQDFLKIDSFLTDPPLPLSLSRKTCENFLTDKDLLQAHLDTGGSPRPLPGIFVIESPSAACQIIWDPQTCRMLGVLSKSEARMTTSPVGKAPAAAAPSAAAPSATPPPLTASGPHPLRRSTGAYGDPVYFGFRWLHGRPGFLYTIGSLIVEEWIWLEDPTLLRQHFRIRSPESDVIVLLPTGWSDEVTATAGTIKEGVLTVPAANAAEFAITTRLKPAPVPPAP
jgi:hypothetical protein